MPDPEKIANNLKRPVVARSARLERELLARYGEVWRAARDDLATIARDSAEARRAGSTLAAVKLAQTSRIDEAVGQVESQISLIADIARREITDAQIDAVLAGHVNAEQLIEEVLGPVPEGAVGYQPQFLAGAFREIVGFSADGQPLGDLLAELGSQAAQDIRRKLTVAVALGRNPRVTAASIRASLGGNAARALTIARTEQLRAYREAARQTYAANKDVVQGWQWTAQLDSRTCAVCVAMHGEMFETEDSLDSHPNCRCTMTPVTKGWAEILGDEFADVPDTRVTMEPGADWFAGQPEFLQRAILGPGRLDLYRAGTPLSAMVQKTRSRRWGAGRRVAPLGDLAPTLLPLGVRGATLTAPASIYYHGFGTSGAVPLSVGKPDWDKRYFVTPDKAIAQRYADRYVDGTVREVFLAKTSRVFHPTIAPIDYRPERLVALLSYAEKRGYTAVHFGGGIGTVVLDETRVRKGRRQ